MQLLIKKFPARRFTLIEMLVVIAIIGILAAMLSPALRRALVQAQGAACANNLKQSYLGMTMYADAHHGYYPAPDFIQTVTNGKFLFGPGKDFTLNWVQSLLYSNGNYPLTWSAADQAARNNHETYAVFSCPAAPVFKGSDWKDYAWNQVFGMNPMLMKWIGQKTYNGSISVNNTPVARARAARKRTTTSNAWIKPNNPSRTAFLMDSATSYATTGTPPWARQLNVVAESHANIFLRHSELANICALDGSVRSCPMLNLCIEYNINSYADADGYHENVPGKVQ